MGFGPFILISLFYALIGVRVVGQLIRNWRPTFDRQFTAADRALVDQAAFFVLVPISVALHELGHAAAIRGYGGSIEGWGYYLFAGFVGYDPSDFTQAQRILVAAAGTLVNLLLVAVALAVVFGPRPPRAAINTLLLRFVFLSLINALVLYPLLDLASGLNGDWSQMYRGGVPALSAAIGVVHAAILALLWWAWRGDRFGPRIMSLTDAPPAIRRVRLDGRRPAGPTAAPATETTVEAILSDAASRVASGWPERIEAATQQRPDGTLLVLSWRGGGAARSVLALARTGGGIDLAGAVGPDGAAHTGRPLGREPGPPDADRLTLALRLAMEQVEGWPAEVEPSRSS